MGLIPGSGRSLEGGYGNPLQYSCPGNPINRGAWKATVQTVTRSQTPLNTHAHTPHPGIHTTPTRGALSSALNQDGDCYVISNHVNEQTGRGGVGRPGGGRKKGITLVVETQWNENPGHQIEECYSYHPAVNDIIQNKKKLQSIKILHSL